MRHKHITARGLAQPDRGITQMKVFKNTAFIKRNYDCTNVVACEAENNEMFQEMGLIPSNWVEGDRSILNGLSQIYMRCGVRFYGYL